MGVSTRLLFTPLPNVPSNELSLLSYNVMGNPLLRRVVPDRVQPSVSWLRLPVSRSNGRS